jgi:hypothetical protein
VLLCTFVASLAGVLTALKFAGYAACTVALIVTLGAAWRRAPKTGASSSSGAARAA